MVTVTVLTAFVGYASWAAFVNKDYYVGAGAPPRPDLTLLLALPRRQLRPRQPSRARSSPGGPSHRRCSSSIFPLGFRLTCYYYRKAYYRSFWLAPPACAVADAHGAYTGETRFPLLLQNVHRYFFYFGLVFNVILTIDAVVAFRQPGVGIGFSVGTAVLCINAILLWLYTLSCHACRHLCGAGSSSSPPPRSATGSGRRSPRSTPGTCCSPG